MSWIARIFTTIAQMGSGQPDPEIRALVSANLSSREHFDPEAWYRTYWEPEGVPRAVSDYVYEELGEMSGIDFGSVIPADLMESDLRFDRCAGDSDFEHVERFAKRFHVRKKDVFDGHPEVRDNPSIRKFEIIPASGMSCCIWRE